MSYTLRDYGDMINSRERTEAYRQALRQTIKPGDVVVDLGTGPGLLALLACQCGARRVYAIETQDVVQLGRELAAANGFAGRIEFIEALSTAVDLPEPAQVMVSDVRGLLPFLECGIPSLIDARRRFLAPGGALIPRRDLVWAALVEIPDIYQHIIAPWSDNGYGFKMEAARRLVKNWFRQVDVDSPAYFLAKPVCWWTLDYATVEEVDAQAEVSWQVERAGTAHGLIMWFDAELVAGIGFSNAPGKPKQIYRQIFFPFSAPVVLAEGDLVATTISARLLEVEYLWRWDTRILDQGQPGHLKADFRQSTFHGAPLSPTKLLQRAASHIPVLDEDGQIDRLILNEMDGKTSLLEIVRRLLAEFPQRFASENRALSRVGELSLKYGRPLDNKYLLKDI